MPKITHPKPQSGDPWQVLDSQTVYQGRLTVAKDRLLKPTGDEMDYTYLAGGEAAAVLAFTPEKQVVLTRQYRHPLRRTIFDLPAGGLQSGEDPEEAARRELAEETCFTAQAVRLLGRLYYAPGLTSGVVYVFLAHVQERGRLNLDEHEIIEVVLMDWSEVLQLVLSDEAVDSALGYAVLRYAVERG